LAASTWITRRASQAAAPMLIGHCAAPETRDPKPTPAASAIQAGIVIGPPRQPVLSEQQRYAANQHCQPREKKSRLSFSIFRFSPAEP